MNLNRSADAPSSCANFLRFKSEIGPILAEISHFLVERVVLFTSWIYLQRLIPCPSWFLEGLLWQPSIFIGCFSIYFFCLTADGRSLQFSDQDLFGRNSVGSRDPLFQPWVRRVRQVVLPSSTCSCSSSLRRLTKFQLRFHIIDRLLTSRLFPVLGRPCLSVLGSRFILFFFWRDAISGELVLPFIGSYGVSTAIS